MAIAPVIQVVRVGHGPQPSARSLNPRFSGGMPLLVATLDVTWAPGDPAAAVAALEKRLLAFSPGLARHECRGLAAYQMFAGPAAGSGPFEAPLALAHLVEHAIIDFQCAVMRQRRCSGVTAAVRDAPSRYDLLVECPDPPVGRCCLGLAIAWVQAAAAGHPLDDREREVLQAARVAYERRGEGLRPAHVARALRFPLDRAERALTVLTEVGYLVESPYSVNLSGVPEYRVSLT